MKASSSFIAIVISVLLAALIAVAGGQHGVTAYGYPVIWYCAALAFVVQWLAYIPAQVLNTEHFYDLTGSLTYISVAVLALLLSSDSADPRALLLVGLVLVWALRLGTFLFRRISAAGKDGRFDEIKTNPMQFLMTWTLQGLWVFLTLACALAAILNTRHVPLGWPAALGILVWLTGFSIEAIADAQKSAFRRDTRNRQHFIRTGLWAWSRHPNYFGEILLWVGISIIALPTLQGWQWLTLISPIFVYVLLTKISGVPMLEKRADEKWGGQLDYENYKASTPALSLRPPKARATHIE